MCSSDLPVPALEEVVRERTAFYDASFLSADPDFVHAHITLLSPWAELPTAADQAEVTRITQPADPFDIQLAARAGRVDQREPGTRLLVRSLGSCA